MKINNSNVPTGLSNLENVKSKSVNSDDPGLKNKSNVDSSESSARVDMSARAQMFQKAKEIASKPDAIDEAKVARFQKLIDEGKYKVDSKAVADKLVDEQMAFPD